jgi:hypothetical protein
MGVKDGMGQQAMGQGVHGFRDSAKKGICRPRAARFRLAKKTIAIIRRLTKAG